MRPLSLEVFQQKQEGRVQMWEEDSRVSWRPALDGGEVPLATAVVP